MWCRLSFVQVEINHQVTKQTNTFAQCTCSINNFVFIVYIVKLRCLLDGWSKERKFRQLINPTMTYRVNLGENGRYKVIVFQLMRCFFFRNMHKVFCRHSAKVSRL